MRQAYDYWQDQPGSYSSPSRTHGARGNLTLNPQTTHCHYEVGREHESPFPPNKGKTPPTPNKAWRPHPSTRPPSHPLGQTPDSGRFQDILPLKVLGSASISSFRGSSGPTRPVYPRLNPSPPPSEVARGPRHRRDEGPQVSVILAFPLSSAELVHHLCGVVFITVFPPARVHRIIPLHAQDPNP